MGLLTNESFNYTESALLLQGLVVSGLSRFLRFEVLIEEKSSAFVEVFRSSYLSTTIQ